MAIADYLVASPLVEEVFYPGLPGHLRYDVAARQMSGFGGMVSFAVKDLETAKKFCENLNLAYNAASLGMWIVGVASDDIEPRGMHGRGTKEVGDRRGTDSLLDRDRGHRGPHRRH